LKIIFFTGNSIRHKFLANSILDGNQVLVISECKENTALYKNKKPKNMIDEHFNLRYNTEKDIFKNNEDFNTKFISLENGKINTPEIFERIKLFDPRLMISFGSSIIKEPLLSLLPKGHFLNVHLGISPYYRGSGTNFWPFVNNELEYVGSTILHIDPGIDTGDIITHVIPKIELGDDVHKLGCKVIQESVIALQKIMDIVKEGKELPRTKQWIIDNEKYYKNKDFNGSILLKYKENLKNGIVEKFLGSPKSIPKLINI
jgi:methionyl-tRNA formyltransferase